MVMILQKDDVATTTRQWEGVNSKRSKHKNNSSRRPGAPAPTFRSSANVERARVEGM